jgi:predicted RNase H-like HicB family nuclease
MKRVRVIYRHESGQWSAEAPDAPGYSAVADSLPELRRLVREGLRFFLDEPVVVEEASLSVGRVAVGGHAFNLASVSAGIGSLNSAQNDAAAKVAGRRGPHVAVS